MFKKIIASALALALVVGAVPGTVNAEDETSSLTVTELPYEATAVSAIGGKYFQIKNEELNEYNRPTRRAISVIDTLGKEIFPYIYSPLSYSFSDGIFSLAGERIEYVYGVEIHDESYAEEANAYVVNPAFYDETGKEIFDASFLSSATAMSGGYALVKAKGTPCIINSSGEIVFKLPSETTKDMIGLGDLWYITQYDGTDELKYAIYYNYSYPDSRFGHTWVSEGLMGFNSSYTYTDKLTDENMGDRVGYKQGYIDMEGNIVIPQELNYDDYFPFHQGYAKVKKDQKFGYIDKTGKEVIPTIYDSANNFEECGLAMVSKENVWSYINASGETVIELADYDATYGCDGNVFTVVKDGKCGAVDKDGNIVIPLEWDDISSPVDGVCMAIKDGKVYSVRFASAPAETEPIGDINNDGFVDSADASLILVMNADGEELTDEQMAAGDVNGDGLVDPVDASLILVYNAYVAGGGELSLTDWLAE